MSKHLTAEQYDSIMAAKGTGTPAEVARRLAVSDGQVAYAWRGLRKYRPGDKTLASAVVTPAVTRNLCGLSIVERVDRYHEQGDTCYLCHDRLDFDVAQVEHDHSHEDCYGKGCPNCVRGLAHPKCNTGIGMFDDDPGRMRIVADSLEQAIKV